MKCPECGNAVEADEEGFIEPHKRQIFTLGTSSVKRGRYMRFGEPPGVTERRCVASGRRAETAR